MKQKASESKAGTSVHSVFWEELMLSPESCEVLGGGAEAVRGDFFCYHCRAVLKIWNSGMEGCISAQARQ